MKDNLPDKLKKLKKILKNMNSCLIAYSGGADSSFLLKILKDTLGSRVLAVTAVSATYPKEELVQAKKIAQNLGVKHLIIRTDELTDPNFKRNPFNRCYYCKKELFDKLSEIARKFKIRYIIDGTNCDDKNDFRPGELAKKEFGIRSPLKKAGFRKKDIRLLSKRLGLSTWDKPALACLASRLPYGMTINERVLKRIAQAEKFIRTLGFQQVRIRDYGNLARIEVEKKDITKLITTYNLQLTTYLKKLGYTYITLDLEGYRTGSMNPAPSLNSGF
jgi:uncharacterized protein